ncbi:MAG: hypothetical protein Q7R81_00040 [Candidatus Peregrinibacteria bacterium]|nr:hypothetical protein [Candidatus Peregrinibacteria bacterium]
MNHYKGLTDSYIPTTTSELNEELKELEQEGGKVSGRQQFLEEIRAISKFTPTVSLEDLQGLYPNEIFDLLSIVSTDLSTPVEEFMKILREARQQLRRIILLKVLGITTADLE